MQVGDAQTPADSRYSRSLNPEEGARTWSRPIVFAGGILAITLGGLLLLRILAEPLVLLFMAIVIAEALVPVADWLHRWMPRFAAIIAIYCVLLALLVGFFLFVVPPLAVETQKAVTNLPHLLKLTASLINRVAPGQGQRIVKSVQPAVLQMAAGFAAPSAGVLSALAAAVP